MRFAAFAGTPAFVAIFASCSLSLVASDAFAVLPAATYSAVLTSVAVPTGNPGCQTPPVQCIDREFLTAPGSLTTSIAGPVNDAAHASFGAVGPRISVSGTSDALTASVDHASGTAVANIQYSVEIVGPAGNVPVNITASGGVSATNGFSGGSAVALLSVTQAASGYSGFIVACAADPSNTNPACAAQQSFSGTYSLTFAANSPITVGLLGDAGAYSPYVGTFSAQVDPVFSIDPGFPNAAAYTISVSPGVTQSTGTGPAAPVFVSAVSRKVHGAAGTFDLALSALATNPTTEPRIGPTQTIVLTFDKPIGAATATITEGTGTAAGPAFSGNDVIVNLTNVTNQQYLTVSLTNVASSDGGTGGTGSVRVGFLLGDVNQNRVVTLADLGLVNAQLAQSVTVANYLKDVNASGTLTLADKGITNTNLTKALPPP